jgi:LacI family transcriptional regulator
MKKSRVTLKDIAQRAGVSHTTVSRALRNHPDISIEMRERIKELARTLHYNPNAIALSLRNAHTHVIGLILPEITFYAFPSLVKGVTEYCYNQGYNVMILSSDESLKRETQNIQILLSNQVDGVLVAVTKETNNAAHFKTLEDNGIPTVFFDRVPGNYVQDSVIIDDKRAAYELTRHLIGTGKKHLLYFGGNRDLSITQNRLRGFRQALAQSNMSEYDAVFASDSYQATRITEEIFMRKHIPDAIMAISDEVLTGIMPVLQNMDIKIPDQVAVGAFSDGPLSKMYKPEITIIHHSLFRIGQVAAEVVIQKISNPSDHIHQTRIIDTDLIVRGSTIKNNK